MNKTFFDEPKDKELKDLVAKLMSYIEPKLTEEQNEMVGNILTYIEALTDPEDYAERYIGTNYISDTSDPDYEVPPTTAECIDMQKSRVADYFCS